MSSSKQFAIDYLKAVERQHSVFFTTNRLKIMDCVTFKGTRLVTVHVVKGLLPDDIVYDIEIMFWIE